MKTMNSEKLLKLKVAVNQFYLNRYMDQPLMTDEEYDQLVKDYEAEGSSVKDLIEWEKGEKVKNEIKIGLKKTSVDDNNLRKAVNDYLIRSNINIHYCTPKYDGCAVIGIYEKGKLKQVRSTPDESYGILRTKSFWNIFPHEIEDKSIIALQGEALVDCTNYGQKARNKANGLVNSINMESEVENEIFVRIYRVYFEDQKEFDFHRSLAALVRLPRVIKTRVRQGKSYEDLVFCATDRFIESDCPEDAISRFESGYFQCDGVVLYSDKGVLGFKYYYTESAITTVTKIDWNYQSNGSYIPKIKFDKVRLNDKNISQAASGGVPNLLAKKMGVGAKVRVILSKMTIPKIIEVLEPSEDYQFPTCKCGHVFSKLDILGSALKCGTNDICTRNFDNWDKQVKSKLNKLRIKYQLDDNARIFIAEPYQILDLALQIDRWESKKTVKRIPTEEELSELIINISDENIEEVLSFLNTHFKMSSLNVKNLLKNIKTSVRVLKDNLNN